ncbi:MAG TPA: TIGR00266 family protein [Thermoanaerobaculia bacterium]|nr:TIGR00266 family protein [Thermoanaerobaculia bacterium]
MSEWYVSVGGGQEGPLDEEAVRQRIRSGQLPPAAYVFRQGMEGWAPVRSQPEFARDFAGAAPPPPPPPAAGAADEIDYEIHGEEMQFVEITLDPNEACIAEAGAFMFMDPGVQMETIFGDGSAQSQQGGVMGKLLGAGKRVLTGESLFMTVFANTGGGRQKVAFASPYPGKIIPLDLRQHDRTILCQKDSFLVAAKGISVGVAFQRKLGAGLFGGEGFILQKLEGDGLCFVHACGTIVARDLAPGEALRVDTGCLVAMEKRVDYDVQTVSGIKTAIFGGEGLFFARLTGPGRVWLQSLPFSRLAGRVLSAVPRGGKNRRGEGSVLGDLGEMFMGD